MSAMGRDQRSARQDSDKVHRRHVNTAQHILMQQLTLHYIQENPNHLTYCLEHNTHLAMNVYVY